MTIEFRRTIYKMNTSNIGKNWVIIVRISARRILESAKASWKMKILEHRDGMSWQELG